MNRTFQTFGGSWTEEKLERVRKYLVAYATIMNKQKFRFAYIDAFAGTGYRTLEQHESSLAKIFPEVFERESQAFLDGSARIALQIRPRLPLLNSRNIPLYLLCFASGNPKGSKTAIKIAQDILKR